MSQFVQQDFLDLLDRLLPLDYLEGLKKENGGAGYEVLQAAAKAMERLSLAIDRLETGAFISTAASGARATVQVTFSRPTDAAGAFTLQKGTVVTTSQGRDFLTVEDAVFGATDLSKTVLARAFAQGWEYNVPGPTTTADGTPLPGMIDGDILSGAIKRPIEVDPNDPTEHFVDASVTVAQVADATGGAADMLGALGHDRGVEHLTGETDAVYRSRIRQLPDTVTPDAITRAVNAFLSPFGGTFEIIETYDTTFQTFYDVPNSNVFTYDDPRPSSPFRNRWLDDRFIAAAFIVVVSQIAPIRERGMAYDDPETSVSGYATANGLRACCAFDLPDTLPANILAGAYDGFDSGRRAVWGGLFQMLEKIEAFGVAVALILDGQ